MQEVGTIPNRIIPGSSVLLGLGYSNYGELWTNDTHHPKVKAVGCEFNLQGMKEREDGYTVDHGADQFLRSQGQRHIKQIACGSLHTLLLEFNGRCWAVGDNADGQLGLGSNKKAKYPTLIRGDIENQRIECIGTGGWFSAFLSVTGQVFTCGNIARQFWDNDRQIMVSNHGEKKQTQYIPRAVIMKDIHDGVHRICKIGCGNRFLLMQDLATMNVYDLGNPNPHLGREQDDPYPSLTHYIHPVTLNRNLIDFQCKKIDGGEIFSVLLDYKGNLFTASLQEDYVCVQALRTRNVPVIDVCCSWAEYIALDASGLVHIGNVVHKELVTLLSLGPMKQIGAGNIQMYARSGKTVFKISEGTASDQTTPEQLQFEEEVDLNEKEFIQLTGCYFTTMIHLANVKCLPLMPNIHSLRMRQVLCDVTIICATNNNDYEM